MSFLAGAAAPQASSSDSLSDEQRSAIAENRQRALERQVGRLEGRTDEVLERLAGQQFVPFVSLFRVSEGRLGVVVTFLALMELIKEALVEIVQTENFGPIHVMARSE